MLGGFKDNGQLSTNPLGLPDPWVPGNYIDILAAGVVLAAASATARSSRWPRTVVVVAVSAMAAYVFARFAFRGRELLFTLFAIGLMFPFAVAILPLFILLRGMGLLDNPLGRDPARRPPSACR